MFDLSVLR